jgi:hypothetical protein
MDDDDDTSGAGSLLSQLLAQAWQGDAEADRGEIDPGPAAPVAGIGLGLGTALPWLVRLLSDPLLSPAEEAFLHARIAAEKFRQAGDDERGDIAFKLTMPKRSRGRPAQWTDDDRMSLAMAMAEELHADPTLRSVRAVCRRVSERPEWEGRGGAEVLRKQFDHRAKRKGRTLEQELTRLRGPSRPAK